MLGAWTGGGYFFTTEMVLYQRDAENKRTVCPYQTYFLLGSLTYINYGELGIYYILYKGMCNSYHVKKDL